MSWWLAAAIILVAGFLIGANFLKWAGLVMLVGPLLIILVIPFMLWLGWKLGMY